MLADVVGGRYGSVRSIIGIVCFSFFFLSAVTSVATATIVFAVSHARTSRSIG